MANRVEAAAGTDLDGLMSQLRLSEAERKGLRVEKRREEGGKEEGYKALGKVFTEKSVSAKGIVMSLGQIWCSGRGIQCKDLGNNVFLIRFSTIGGWRRALEDGPWDVGSDLLILTNFVRSKRVEDYEFVKTPIWIRVKGLPLRMMDKTTGERIGGHVGDLLETDVDDDGEVVGRFLRIKVLIDVRVPLMRGVTMVVDGEEEAVGEREIFCEFEYGFLPKFCHLCGLLGHVDRECTKGDWKAKEKPYSNKLRFWPNKNRGSNDFHGRRVEKQRGSEGRFRLGSRSRFFSSQDADGGSKADGEWRRKEVVAVQEKAVERGQEKEIHGKQGSNSMEQSRLNVGEKLNDKILEEQRVEEEKKNMRSAGLVEEEE